MKFQNHDISIFSSCCFTCAQALEDVERKNDMLEVRGCLLNIIGQEILCSNRVVIDGKV